MGWVATYEQLRDACDVAASFNPVLLKVHAVFDASSHRWCQWVPVWPLKADHFARAQAGFFAGNIEALLNRQGCAGAGRRLWEVWNVADGPTVLAQPHDWANFPLPTPGTATVVNVTPAMAALAASINSGLESVHGPLAELDWDRVSGLSHDFMRLEASSRPHAFRALAPLFVRTCNEVDVERTASGLTLQVSALRWQNRDEALKGTLMLGLSDTETPAQLASWVRKEYFSSAEHRTGEDGRDRQVHVLRRRRSGSSSTEGAGDEGEDFEASALGSRVSTR
jgi:hypothetical protein